MAVDPKAFNTWFVLPPCWCTEQNKHFFHIVCIKMEVNPEEKNVIVPAHQHGSHDVTCKPLIKKKKTGEQG